MTPTLAANRKLRPAATWPLYMSIPTHEGTHQAPFPFVARVGVSCKLLLIAGTRHAAGGGGGRQSRGKPPPGEQGRLRERTPRYSAAIPTRSMTRCTRCRGGGP